MILLLSALAVLVGSGLVAALASGRPRVALFVGALGATVASAMGLLTAMEALSGGTFPVLEAPFSLPAGGVSVGLDPLSACFLVPLFGLAVPAALYGRAYLGGHARSRSLGTFACVLNVLLASMVLVLIARHALLLLFAWEVMTLSAYLLVAFEHDVAEVRRAGFVYLIAGHVSVAALILLFLLAGRMAGGLELERFASLSASGGSAALLFVLALVGFGTKAGLVPLHVWLPEAHAAAPSHVSALMSAVLITLGLYGILRTLTWLEPSLLFAAVLGGLGLCGALYGIAMALHERDLKRALAYSSVENMGIMLLGVALGLWARRLGRPEIAALGVGGALLHVWNHALMKGLLFLCAGGVVHGVGGRDLERMGGLLARMPRTGGLMVLGAVAICGLPPLNGFVSEWLIYLGLGRMGLGERDASGLVALLAFGALALVGGLAALCFVRLVGIALLGSPRGEAARHAHEAPVGMLAPMTVLAVGCVAVALAPGLCLSALRPAISQILRVETAASIAEPVTLLGRVHAGVWLAILFFGLMLLLLVRRRSAAADTWGCGYAGGTARIQYTARSFSELVTSHLLPPSLRARIRVAPPDRLFPARGSFSTDASDPVTRGWYEPFLTRWADRFARLRWVQQGVTHAYISYILAVILLAMAWASIRAWLSP